MQRLNNVLANELLFSSYPLRNVPMTGYGELSRRPRSSIYGGTAGQGGLYLAYDMATKAEIKPGDTVLDLACGTGTTSQFLSETFGTLVYAVDQSIPTSAWRRSLERVKQGIVFPVKADCRQLPFEERYFDAIFCMNAFFYFGTDNLYPSYIFRFLKPGGRLVIGGRCFLHEPDSATAKEVLLGREFGVHYAIHTPDWWKHHIISHSSFEMVESIPHVYGREFWEDRVLYAREEILAGTLSDQDLKSAVAILRMLAADQQNLSSHFILTATRPDSASAAAR